MVVCSYNYPLKHVALVVVYNIVVGIFVVAHVAVGNIAVDLCHNYHKCC